MDLGGEKDGGPGVGQGRHRQIQGLGIKQEEKVKDRKKKKKEKDNIHPSIHPRNRCQHPPKSSQTAPDSNTGAGFASTHPESPAAFIF